MKILKFNAKKLKRKEYHFDVRKAIVRVDEEYRHYPVIRLVSEKSGQIYYTGLERYVFSLAHESRLKEKTLEKRARVICSFLNYILHETNIDSIHEVDINIIREFEVAIKQYYNNKGEIQTIDRETWSKKIFVLTRFLDRYYWPNYESLEFKYTPEELSQVNKYRDERGQLTIVESANYLGIKPPPKKEPKNRILLFSYLSLMIIEAKKYAPELVLPIMLQAYSGLREGEIVNVTLGDIKLVYAHFGILSNIKIDIKGESIYFSESTYSKKTNPGSIKRHREQEVYPDFICEVEKALYEHERIMETKWDTYGYSEYNSKPLLLNDYGKPQTVKSYTDRIKALFMDHFLPDLEAAVVYQNTWELDGPFVEAYKEEYPGAHMFRHWFTMYLLKKTEIGKAKNYSLIARWRGDKSESSFKNYVSRFFDLIEDYGKSDYKFTESVINDARGFIEF